MSWVTNKATLDSTLKGLGFKQNPGLLKFDELFAKDRYHVEVEGVKTTDITDNGAFSEYYVTVSLSYICNDNSEYDSMVDSFITVLDAIRGLVNYAGFISDSEITRMEEDNKKVIAKASFIYGVQQCQ